MISESLAGDVEPNDQNDGTTMSMICEPATSEVFSLAEELTSKD